MSLFNIIIDPAAEKDLKKFKRSNPKLLSRFIAAIDSLIHNPYQGKPLKGDKKGCYSLREADTYRIIYEMYPAQKIIHIIRVGHRREIYR